MNYARLPTEQRNVRSTRLDRLSARQIVDLMNREDRALLSAVAAQRPAIARAVDLIVSAMGKGGRLFLAGAGTSGRLGVLEAAECPPTFDTRPSQIQAFMAGGRRAVFRSQEGAEDSARAAEAVIKRQVRKGDVVVGIAASGVTAFARTALQRARAQGARTILLTCNPGAQVPVDVRIAVNSGPEVLAGSTRLKAGTACKMVLNMLTTASMVRLGKVYGNRMVDLQPRSRKLVARGQRLIAELADVSPARAAQLLLKARGRVKPAILMARRNISYAQALRHLHAANGFLGKALEGK